MKRTTKRIGLVLLSSVGIWSMVIAQDLDPRSYVKLPVKGNLLISNLAFSQGGIVTDATLPLTDLKATVESVSVGYARTFRLFGQTAQAFAALPYGWANASAIIDTGVVTAPYRDTITRSGIADMRIRCSILLLGGKAATLSEFSQARSRTILGTSLMVVVPTGEFFPDKLINLGTNRWAFKPEVALSQLVGKRWMIDVYSGVWLFTTNHSFYPGNSVRTQDPLVSFQAHLSYNINARTWLALNATYYTGGRSTVNDVIKDDRQENSRFGGTVALPVGKKNALKIAFSTGAIIRAGANFTTVSVGWSTAWFAKS